MATNAYVVYKTTTQEVAYNDIYTTQAAANAAGVDSTKTAIAGVVSVPDDFETGQFFNLETNTFQRSPIIISSRAAIKQLSGRFITEVLVPFIEPMTPHRQRWLNEQNFTQSRIVAARAELAANAGTSTVTAQEKRIIQFDYWLDNLLLVPHVSGAALRAMTTATPQATIIAKVSEMEADIAYAKSEVVLGGVNIVEFWYANASLQFLFYPLGSAWRTGRGAQLGQAVGLYKTVAVPAGWVATTAANTLRVWSLGL